MTINLPCRWDNKIRTEGDVITKTIYIDVLICINLIINYFILLAAGKFTRAVPKQYRILLGAVFGAFSSLIILLPQLSFMLNLLSKLIIAAIIVFITYGYKNIKLFIKNIGVFFLISFCFCGLMIGVWFIFTPKGMVINNSVVYFNISPIVMIISSVICYFILRLISRLSGREASHTEICKIKINGNAASCELLGKIDTGNALTEPFSDIPVIVADKEAVENILPNEIKLYFQNNGEYKSYGAYKNIRLIPFSSVGGTGVMPAFIPNEIYINSNRLEDKVYIAVCGNNRIKGECKAMVNPEIMSNIRSDRNENRNTIKNSSENQESAWHGR